MIEPRNRGRAVPLLVTAAIASTIYPGEDVYAQSVADRVLSDVRVNTSGTCATLTVNFNIRVQVLSFFPQTSGRELHVRVKPLDQDFSRLARESLRTPSGVPALRSIEFEGDNPSGPVLSLFFTRDVRFDVAAGKQPQSVVITLDEPGSGELCPATSSVSATAPATGSGAVEQVAKPDIPIPAGLYVVNVLSQPKDIGDLPPTQAGAIKGQIAYETRFERDAQIWHRLRVGFFVSREEAEAARKQLAKTFPEAWVTKVTAQERLQGVTTRLDTGTAVTTATAAPPAGALSEADQAAVGKLLSDSEAAIKSGENDRAVQLLTKALTFPENPQSARAQELLGLTRERKGQMAHAQAEYEEYLRRYPEGEGADRVRQRLAAILNPGAAAPALRPATGSMTETRSANAWDWRARGSFSQFYFRDQSTIKSLVATPIDRTAEVDNSVNLNQLLTTADVTVSGGNDRNQLQMRAAGSYTGNFRPGGRDIKSLNALYADFADNELNYSMRVGRQTKNGAGILGRFDGAMFGWQARPKVRLNFAGGVPVLTSRQLKVLNDRYFYGASVDIGSRSDKLQTTLYWFDQHSRKLIDRRSVGLESRYVNAQFNSYAIVDYDVKYSKLNLGLLTLNYTLKDTSTISFTADYRRSPLLTTNNALIGQADPLTFAPILDLRDLRTIFSDNQIYQLALDRTLVAKSMTLTYARPITKKLQTNIDFTLTNTGGTPSSGGVQGFAAQGREYFYGAQLIGSGLLWSNDIYILSGRYADTQRSRTYTADINARVPVTDKLRISPRARYGLREDKTGNSTFRQFQPMMRINYYPIRHSEIEIEFGGNFSRDRATIGTTTTRGSESGYVLSAGYRLDF